MSRMLERSTSCNFTIDCGEGHDTADCETCVVVAAVERFSPVTLPRNEQVGVWGAPVQVVQLQCLNSFAVSTKLL